jgi:acetyl esterase/lipase
MRFVHPLIFLFCVALGGGSVHASEMSIPSGFVFERDVAYGPEEPWQRLDILHSGPADARKPAILLIHGGGWRKGDKDRADFHRMMARLAEHGFVSLSINYRLSGTAKFPAAVDDCKLAVRWLRAHADRFGVHPGRIGVIGGSAGGHLAGMLAVARDTNRDEPYGAFSNKVQAVVPACAPFDLRVHKQLPNEDRDDIGLVMFLGGTAEEKPELAAEASVNLHVRGDEPPMLIIHGLDDRRVSAEQSRRMAARLLEAGSPHELVLLEGKGHGVGIAITDEAMRQRVLDFFTEHLKTDR